MTRVANEAEALHAAIHDRVPEAVLMHTGGGCWAVAATTPQGLFDVVATSDIGTITYLNGSTYLEDNPATAQPPEYLHELEHQWAFEQMVAEPAHAEIQHWLTPADVCMITANFARQWRDACELEDNRMERDYALARQVIELLGSIGFTTAEWEYPGHLVVRIEEDGRLIYATPDWDEVGYWTVTVYADDEQFEAGRSLIRFSKAVAISDDQFAWRIAGFIVAQIMRTNPRPCCGAYLFEDHAFGCTEEDLSYLISDAEYGGE